jgi:signal transduction histidine kinase
MADPGQAVYEAGATTVRLLPPGRRGVGPRPLGGAVDVDRRHREQLGHDIRNGLATVMMLASLLAAGPDVGPEGRRRAQQLLDEASWLRELENAALDDRPTAGPAEPISLDQCAREIVAVLQLSTAVSIEVETDPTWAYADGFALGRALRNILDNAIRAAGTTGKVVLSVGQADGWAVARVDDDGPGFGAVIPGHSSLGLDIVQQSVVSCGGRLEIRDNTLGGCSVCLSMPAAPAPDPGRLSTAALDPSIGDSHAASDL